MKGTLRQVALAALVVVFPNAAAAQEQRLYAGAGGTTVGVTAEAGGFLSRTVGVTFEASIPARFDSVQETRDPGGPTDNQHRDIVLSGLFHSHLPSVGRLRAAIVLGPSIAYEDTVQTYPGYRGELQLTRWTWGVTLGADFGIQVRRNVAVVPQIRVDWIDRVHLDTTSFPDVPYALLGLSSWVFRPGVGIRATF